MMKTYGLIGLGNLGEKIAKNILKNHFNLKIYDLDKNKSEALKKKGAVVVKDINDIITDVDGIITCLPSPKISTNVMMIENKLLYKMSPGTVWIETSTTEVTELLKVSKEATKYGINTIEAPVTGGVHKAEKGNITVLVGANNDQFKIHKKILKSFGGKIFLLGDVGSASILKVITNMLAFANLVGSVEGLMLAKMAGLDMTASYHAIQASSGNSAEFETVAPTILNGSFNTAFTLALACKDLKLMSELGKKYEIPMEFTNFIEKFFVKAKNKFGPNEWTPIFTKDYEKLAGKSLRTPNFPDKMMEYKEVVKYLNKMSNNG